MYVKAQLISPVVPEELRTFLHHTTRLMNHWPWPLGSLVGLVYFDHIVARIGYGIIQPHNRPSCVTLGKGQRKEGR